MTNRYPAPSTDTEVRSAILAATGLNVVFIVLEVVFGFRAGSLALLSDAGHNLGDVLGLLLAWGAILLARSAPSARRTYGMRRTAALANALVLLVAIGAVAVEAVRRLGDATPIAAPTVVTVAFLGILVNGVSAWLVARSRRHDVNVRAAAQHLFADAAISLGVVLAGVGMVLTHWWWLDPVVSLLMSAVIVVSIWKLLRKSLDLALDAVPEQIDPAAVQVYLESLPDVVSVHDIHIWATSTTETTLTAHLVTDRVVCDDDLTSQIARELSERAGIVHSTLQWESTRRIQPCRQGGNVRASP